MLTNWKRRARKFLVSEDGPTTVEYAVLLALLVGMMVASIWYVRAQAVGVHDDIATGLTDVGFFK